MMGAAAGVRACNRPAVRQAAPLSSGFINPMSYFNNPRLLRRIFSALEVRPDA